MEFLNKLSYIIHYFGRPPWDTGISPPELIEFINITPPGNALDLGCGTGTNVITLANHGWQVTGIDFVRKAIRSAERKAEHAGIDANFIVGDVTEISLLKCSYDLVLDIGCFHSLGKPNKIRYIQNLDQLISPGGTFLIYGWLSSEEQIFPGITDIDIDSLKELFSLVDTRSGTERGTYPSAWMKFERTIDG